MPNIPERYEPNCILDYANLLIANGATYDQIISELELARDALNEEDPGDEG